MSSRTKLVGISLLSYAIGVLLSPYLLPVDFLTTVIISHEQQSNNDAAVANENANDDDDVVVDSPSFKYEAVYKDVIDDDDPFHNVDIVLHRNGEPDACARQQQQPSSGGGGGSTASWTKMLTLLGMNKDASSSSSSTTDKQTSSLSPLSQSILRSSEQFEGPLSFDSKYDVDSILTHAFADISSTSSSSSLFPHSSSNNCGPTWEQDDTTTKPHYLDQAHDNGVINLDLFSSLLKYCDMGIDRTPIQPDHKSLVRLAQVKSLPCTFHTREGVRVTSLSQLAELAREVGMKSTNAEGECSATNENTCTITPNNDGNGGGSSKKELHLYAVSAGRVFMFAPKYVGEIFELPHVKGPKGLPVSLQVMSLKPRVFDIYNFFDRVESAAIVDKALKETSETHRMKRSSTGASGYNLNSKRTSENGFDTHGKEAQIVKKRCMNILGFDEYEESLTDGLQVLRYNKTTGYFPHMDWIDDPGKKEEHNFDSAGVGSNRFATILLYMSDLEERDGGETLFSHGWPVGQAEEDRVSVTDAIEALRASGDVEGILKRDSWEEKMVAQCRSRLSVRPHSSRAVLFYSQHPDGSADSSSLHGGCPVITDQPKWAANLWAWNAPRGGFPGSPKNQHVVEKNRAANKAPSQNDLQKHAQFINTKSDESMRHAKLFFQDTFWGEYGFDDPPLGVNTFMGHKWHVQVNGQVVKTFTIGNEKEQVFNI